MTFSQTDEAKNGALPLVHRHTIPVDNAIFQLAGVLRRLKVGEKFAAWIGNTPSSQPLDVLKTAGSDMEVNDNWDRQNSRLVMRRTAAEKLATHNIHTKRAVA